MPSPDGSTARWNHNIHYHRVVLGAAPARPPRALDVGCGDGLLTAELAGIADEVVGLDADPGTAARARGLARVERLPDLAHSLLAAACHRPYVLLTGRRFWEHSAPTVWPPPEGYAAMRELTRELLPGARFRRLLFWRYSIVWSKPATDGTPYPTTAPSRSARKSSQVRRPRSAVSTFRLSPAR
ncbi:methyltransferase domain-containing protein [Pseudonocardia humida]|uniref:Methyltransferase domain-containing protein n=1 Tax=Pseudonocardia humida TaxID=2800819 RepID=A0ABT0ZTL3_9PSEU|nr:methyltransferase domain-containing protein [Pseudonocardia humida]MCO1654072.1 methyltransferase domain-containing protein [Pseudonocardia humida]